MSPRRRIEAAQQQWFRGLEPAPRRRGLTAVGAIAAAVIIAAVTISAVVFAKSQAARRDQIRDAAVLTSMRSFITQYTSPDPFNANAYADNILKMGTGNFAKMFSDRINEVVVQVARAEPGFGSVPEGNIGIERWNGDGSASVIAVSNMTTKMPDGTKVDSISRWEVTAVKEGDQWKVSDLIQVL